MKPFLILQHRYLDETSDNEFNAILQYAKLSVDEVVRVRIEKESIPDIDQTKFSGLIIGGGPSNVSDDSNLKPQAQLRFERELFSLYDQVFTNDFPYLGMCYGMGSVTQYLNGLVSKGKFSEPVGAVDIQLTNSNDPILEGVPKVFRAFVGHKESCQSLPPNTVLLASSGTCPYQMIRFKNNIYATQFHPELDIEGIILRIKMYKNHGYFLPDEAAELIERVNGEYIFAPQIILRNFVRHFKLDL